MCTKASNIFRVKAKKKKKSSQGIFNDSRPENSNFVFLTIVTCGVFTIGSHLLWFIVSILHLG